jgi:hypothetical protein
LLERFSAVRSALFHVEIIPFHGLMNSFSCPVNENQSALKPTSRPPQSAPIADLTLS